MAYFNDKKIMLAGLKGDSIFVRYSHHSDGTDFTEVNDDGKYYVGIATGRTAPTDKSEYTWYKFTGELAPESLKNEIVTMVLKALPYYTGELRGDDEGASGSEIVTILNTEV